MAGSSPPGRAARIGAFAARWNASTPPLAERLDIPSVADAATTSPFHLSRALRAAPGCPPWRYVLRKRACRAFALMRDPALTLAEVSQLSGFETHASFIAAVRREFGHAPAQSRRSRTGR